MLELNKRILIMHKITKLTLLALILVFSSGCIQRQLSTTTVQNPNELPIAVTTPLPGTQTIYTPNTTVATQPVYTTPIYTDPGYTQPASESTYVQQRTPYLQGAYSSSYQLKQFISSIAKKYNYDAYELNAIFSTVTRDTEALKKYNVFKTAKPTYSKAVQVGSWDKYRGNFLTTSRINKGVAFWQENAHYLNKAAQKYGVAPEYIVGIIGVETNYGGYTGTHSVLNALTTLSLEYKKRSKFFTSELENYLLMLRDERVDPQRIKGSYAGAFGLAQFMPSSFRDYAVDFNGDGHINLFNKADAIGSIANYFIGKGKWQPNVPVTMMTYYNKNRFYGVPAGHKTNYTQQYMYSIGMRPSSNFNGYKGNVSLIKLSKANRDELWWGTPNFRAITRYNPKDHYAMAVHQLAQAIKLARYGR
ncbi:MAG: Membrane-bound lytic murein transglycosylase B precursor (EC [uncultured Sulfurovum sp.]|uniref:Membrane-bound lytic murein transglycosylase B (EC) n=1 Tax=uncultured Sulfurovum sp. TaxID=269237 RepID=A0A6S6TBJ7_9BACT|nr:MAG: Membrane-bound lytic murein transglycosylase B precursor (EC [uncultured Sulfurovum sp.]